jgi:hypothetical protein
MLLLLFLLPHLTQLLRLRYYNFLGSLMGGGDEE